MKRLTRFLTRGHDVDFRETIQDILEEHKDRTDLRPQEQKMLMNVLALSDLRVDDVMVPRADIIAVEEKVLLRDILEAFRYSEHSRLPVYRETLDNPLGFVHIKDIMPLVLEKGVDYPHPVIPEILRDALFMPPSVPVLDLLLKMQTSRIHMALIIDEYGGTDGLSTIEDLVEQVVGKINDEHDVVDDRLIIELPSGIYEVDGRAELTDLEERLGFGLSLKNYEGDVDTIGGFVTILARRVPQRGEILEYPPHCEFHILDSDPRRVKKLRIILTLVKE